MAGVLCAARIRARDWLIHQMRLEADGSDCDRVRCHQSDRETHASSDGQRARRENCLVPDQCPSSGPTDAMYARCHGASPDLDALDTTAYRRKSLRHNTFPMWVAGGSNPEPTD